jgi:hypothetical protein
MRNGTPFFPSHENPENSNIVVPPEQPGSADLANIHAGTLCTSEADRDMGPLAEIHSALRRKRIARSRVMDALPSPAAREMSNTVRHDGLNTTPKNGAVTYLQLACVDGRHADRSGQADTLERASREAMAILRTLLGRCAKPPDEM